MFGIDAENDRLLETVSALFEVIRNPLGDPLSASINDNASVKVFDVVDAVVYRQSLFINLTRLGSVAINVNVVDVP